MNSSSSGEDSVEARKRLSLNKEKYCNHPLDEENPEAADIVNGKNGKYTISYIFLHDILRTFMF